MGPCYMPRTVYRCLPHFLACTSERVLRIAFLVEYTDWALGTFGLSVLDHISL